MKLETPPSSVHGDDEIMDDEQLNEEDLVYVGDLDEVLEAAEQGDDYDDSGESDIGEPPPDDAVVVFKRHTGSVFCGSIHPAGKLAVTGGEDDKAYVWSIDTGDVVYECAEHEDSVVVANFSHDGVYLATADMGGSVRVVKCATNDDDQWKCIWDYQAGDLTWGRWHPATRVLFCGATAGEIYMWKIPSGETKVLQGHGQKSECGVVLTDGRRLAAGYEDGSVKIWDLKSAAVIHNITFDIAHSLAVNTMDSFHDNNIIATGSLDGKVVLSKSALGKTIGILDAGSEIEALAFCKDSSMSLLAVGTLNGSVSIWDVGRQTVRHRCAESGDENSSGVTSLIWVDTFLVAACLDGSVRIYDGKAGTTLKVLTGHQAELLDISYCSTSNVLLTTSDDGTSRIFKFDFTS